MQTIETFTNIADGVESIVAYGNEKYQFRAIYRDLDAQETIAVDWSNDITALTAKARKFVGLA